MYFIPVYEPGNEKVGNGSLVLSLASGLWNILTLGYGGPPTGTGTEQGLDEVLWSKKPLSDLSLLLLLLLINHSSSDNSTETTNSEDHCYRNALYNCYSHKGENSIFSFL